MHATRFGVGAASPHHHGSLLTRDAADRDVHAHGVDEASAAWEEAVLLADPRAVVGDVVADDYSRSVGGWLGG